MENEEIPQKEEMNTLMECINVLKKRGYTHNFMTNENKTMYDDHKKAYTPEEVTICSFYRFEGESDPADNSILYAIETNTGVKGIITDSYGSTSNTHITKFIEGVEDIHKKVK